MTAAQIELHVTLRMTLAEALEVERRLRGGPETETTRALRLTLNTQLLAASAAIEA